MNKRGDCMNYPIYITHELIMETTKLYIPRNFKRCKHDFENIKCYRKSALGKFIIVEGTVHLSGYKIAGEGYYSGFFDVINQQFYTKDNIKNAAIENIKKIKLLLRNYQNDSFFFENKGFNSNY
jgi:hypothetical protein